MLTSHQINTEAENVLKKNNLFEPNFDITKLAEIYKINLEHSNPGDDDLSGLLMREAESTKIFINNTHSETRQRFSLAHELGHFFLHKGRELFIDGKATGYLLRASNVRHADYTVEREANEFAAALLMPVELINKEIKKLPQKKDMIAKLADKFNVSQQAMSYRLLNLGYIME